MSVVVGYVPDETGQVAVREAARQAQWRGTDLVIVNAVREQGYTLPTAAEEVDLEALSARLTEQGVEHEVRHLSIGTDAVSDALLTVASETGAELIVVGLHRTSPVGKALLGSTAQRVMLGADCPVMALRSPLPR